MGMLPVIAGVLVIVAGVGGAYWYMRKKGPGTGGQAYLFSGYPAHDSFRSERTLTPESLRIR
jgi:hypothetical protein